MIKADAIIRAARGVNIYINGKEVEASVIFGIFCIFATSKTTADEPLPTISPYESPHGDFILSRERPELQICIP
ncbi:MAG: hypothetical protein K5890_01350 [Bacteroidales bacterium]|nr:hypothetical protein [Bacteroidales bacterium]